MRFLHTADWHIGKTLKGHNRLDEQAAVMREIVRTAVSHDVDAVLIAGDIYDSAPYGYVVLKAETEFAQAIADAVRSLIDDGSYLEVLENWGVEDGAITDPAVNPAG